MYRTQLHAFNLLRELALLTARRKLGISTNLLTLNKVALSLPLFEYLRVGAANEPGLCNDSNCSPSLAAGAYVKLCPTGNFH